MNRSHCVLVRLAFIGALATAFALSGCGRKGPLDPPPAAAVAGGQGNGQAQAQSGSDRRIPLDILLN